MYLKTGHRRPKRQFKPINAFIIAVMALGSLGYGYSASIISTTLAQPSFYTYFDLAARSNENDVIGLMNSLYQAGGFLGTFTVAYSCDRWGRRAGIAIPALLILIMGVLLAASVNLAMFIACRFWAGWASYMVISACPVWMTEVVPARNRGSLVAVNGASLIAGFCLAGWVGYGFWHLPDTNNWQWRGPMLLQCLPVAILLPCMYWLPESPRWLIIQGREEEAARVLNMLHTPEEAIHEFQQIKAQTEVEIRLDSSYWALFTKPSYRKRCMLAFTTTVGIQFCGPILIANYGPTLYKSLGFDANKQFVYQCGWLTLAFGGGLLSLFVVDTMPRPILLAGGIAFCLGCLSIEAALVATYASTPEKLAQPNEAALKAAVAMFYIFIVVFEATLDSGRFVYLGELFPTHLRAKGISFGISGVNLINIVWLQVAPTAFANIGWKFYLVLIIPGMAFATLIFFWCPNTKGMPLEEIAELFGDEVHHAGRPSPGEEMHASTEHEYSGKRAEVPGEVVHEHVELQSV
ncbi:hypothetical protein LTR10_018354 [Elasticomyces elasticus]|uniref:Major facilitator superfamily (MFS) profile domain-containing protein n=1 Tax=Exophiala sideris TaxID=1016849 RepID=A0ABR0IZW2_9EURO|nr:hypothetical protein LTR10_018354 [Elasticomyces elasticus]KAK5023203.1 hypothetical protein LTS07_009425 [Exophiala sideris]KAK5028575.1 hypothetical protein LTR13_009026 [Exophiala sideris]KAK5052953.1 hypothetical protein LTR69_009522 [Exophiala sideris]KAK5178693.1 hypothetical protein LTR44_008807 [Eurotiomycetes sp. CCFEE 6388]